MKFLLTSDWHIRDDIPVSRTDDFYETMKRKVRFVFQTAVDYGVKAILNAGDLFNAGRPVQSQLLEIMLMDIFEEYKDVLFLIIPGNHDLPYHNMEELGRSSLGVLIRGGYVENVHDKEIPFVDENGVKWVVIGRGWGSDIPKTIGNLVPFNSRKIVMWHGMVQGSEWVPGGIEGHKFFRDYPDVDLFVTGHNHEKFVIEKKPGRFLVNPGGLLRMSIDEIDKESAVFIFDTLNSSIEEILVPIEKDALDGSYKNEKEERDEKIASFVENMKNEYEVGLSFENNLKIHLKENPVGAEVEKIIWKAVETRSE
jgi:DNA repair exonuclease SbcCD nuclease subunit